MGNLGNPQSIASCQFSQNMYPVAINLAKVNSESMGHLEPIQIIVIKTCPKLLRIYGNLLLHEFHKFTNFIFKIHFDTYQNIFPYMI